MQYHNIVINRGDTESDIFIDLRKTERETEIKIMCMFSLSIELYSGNKYTNLPIIHNIMHLFTCREYRPY